MAVDYGRRRVGLAHSDPGRVIVSHRETILVNGIKDAVGKLVDYVRKNEICEVIVGYPYRQDGIPGELTKDIDKLCLSLQKRLPEITIEKVDERYTSMLAIRYIHQSGKKVGDDKGRVDAAAAGILLDEYLRRGENY